MFGHLTDSFMYYGGYSVGTQEDLQTYSTPKAYFFTSLFAYLFTFIIISVRMARSYRKSFIETSGGLKHVYAHKVFCGWDFSIATEKAAKLKSEAIARELKDNLEEDLRAELLQSNCIHDIYVKFMRIIINALFLFVLTGTGVLVHFLLHRSLLSKLGNISGEVIRVVLNDESATEPGTGESMLLSVVVTTILIVIPKFFSWVVRFEEYRRPRTSLYVTMVRTFLLELVVVAILVVFWLQRDILLCWETSLGQEVYRLIMADFIVAVVAMTIAEFIRSRLNEWYPRIGAPGFDISRNTLNLIHNQTLFWVGFFFSPLLSFVMVVKMYLTFHIKKFGLLRNCEPSSRSWRATQTETLFFVFTFIALLCVLVAYGYIITRVYTSDCGLFSGSNYMYEKILEHAFQLQKGNDFWDFLMFLTKPGVVAGVLLTMCAGVYYLRAQSIAQMQMVKILRQMLYAEAKDKEYLLEKLSTVTGGRKSQIRRSQYKEN
uniref:TMC domain-containing protein n=1 Tax=Clastoptera arizonana TaxID=38151 RepID=A0A1B6C112_9HEMI